MNLTNEIQNLLATRSALKQRTHRHTMDVFARLKKVMAEIAHEQWEKIKQVDSNVPILFQEKGAFEAQIQFSGDLLVFHQHTNTFTFPKDHPIHKNKKVKENPDRAYFGVILLYNFLADSFKYARMNDVGFCIGRIFVNAENHFFMDGNKPFSFLYEDFGVQELTDELLKAIVEQAMLGAIDDELMVPPFDQEQLISVGEKISRDGNMIIATSKKLGFPYTDSTD
jgi:hypothetical protein